MKMIFDVESNGLHGEGFAVGWVILDCGETVSEGFASCPVKDPIPWVQRNVIWTLPPPTHSCPKEIRNVFWEAWEGVRDQKGSLWADCGWPVESKFLQECIADDLLFRQWDGPYPLHEIATVFHVAGLDLLEDWERLEERLEGEGSHNPLGNAKQSARLLASILRDGKSK